MNANFKNGEVPLESLMGNYKVRIKVDVFAIALHMEIDRRERG